MQLTTKHKWFIGGGLTLLALGTIYLVRQARLLYNAVYTVAGIVVKNISLNDINFTLLLKVENKGDLHVDIVEQSYDVYVNKMFVSHIEYPSAQQLQECSALLAADKTTCKNKYITPIASNSSSTIPLNIQFNPSDLLKTGFQNITSILGNQANVIINIKGKLTFKAGPITMKDFAIEETMTLADIVKNSMQVKS